MPFSLSAPNEIRSPRCIHIASDPVIAPQSLQSKCWGAGRGQCGLVVAASIRRKEIKPRVRTRVRGQMPELRVKAETEPQELEPSVRTEIRGRMPGQGPSRSPSPRQGLELRTRMGVPGVREGRRRAGSKAAAAALSWSPKSRSADPLSQRAVWPIRWLNWGPAGLVRLGSLNRQLWVLIPDTKHTEWATGGKTTNSREKQSDLPKVTEQVSGRARKSHSISCLSIHKPGRSATH